MKFQYVSAVALAFMSAIAVSVPAFAQDCDSGEPEATPAKRFKDRGDGTILDTQTKKIWQRCVAGMVWNGKSCEGQSFTYNYIEAKLFVDDMNSKQFGKTKNWRLPTAEELATIVETRCYKPAVNLDVFPFTPESGYWSSSEDKGIVNTRAIIVHFLHGQQYIANQNQTWRIRAVADK